MDRNPAFVDTDAGNLKSLSARRAWIEIVIKELYADAPGSLSARRAWIEMRPRTAAAQKVIVALRKESVDRNNRLVLIVCRHRRSLSARRAWIEIT